MLKEVRPFLQDEPWTQPRLEYSSFTLLSPDGDEHTFKTRTEAASAIGCTKYSVGQLFYGTLKTLKGWTFKSMQ